MGPSRRQAVSRRGWALPLFARGRSGSGAQFILLRSSLDGRRRCLLVEVGPRGLSPGKRAEGILSADGAAGFEDVVRRHGNILGIIRARRIQPCEFNNWRHSPCVQVTGFVFFILKKLRLQTSSTPRLRKPNTLPFFPREGKGELCS